MQKAARQPALERNRETDRDGSSSNHWQPAWGLNKLGNAVEDKELAPRERTLQEIEIGIGDRRVRKPQIRKPPR
jgi:hypothetical protein